MMFGELADNGYKISDYTKIKTFKDLLEKLNLLNNETNKSSAEKLDSIIKDNSIKDITTIKANKSVKSPLINLGVDLVKISMLPQVNDFRESSFYSDNFSIKEIAYCLTKKNPYKCFAGKFAAKEAIIKADNNYKTISFSEIEILNDNKGNPYFAEFSISISHEDDFAIAIVTQFNYSQIINRTSQMQQEQKTISENIQIEDVTNTQTKEHRKSFFKRSLTLSLLINVLMGAYLLYIYFFQ